MKDPLANRKLGKDVKIGDVLCFAQGCASFVVLAFARGPREGTRMALNCWAEGFVLADDKPYRVGK